MLKEEFEKLTGREVTFAEYEVANAMYMSDNNTDKQTFCKMFVKMNLFGYMSSQANYIKKLRRDVHCNEQSAIEAKRLLEESENKVDELKEQLSQHEIHHDMFVERLAIKLHQNAEEIAEMLCDEIGVKDYLSILSVNECTPIKEDVNAVLKSINESK